MAASNSPSALIARIANSAPQLTPEQVERLRGIISRAESSQGAR